LVQNGFRRSGEHIYRPHCSECKACISVRVCINDFYANDQYLKRNFKRVLKRNTDLEVAHCSDGDLAELYKLYEHYISARHRDGDMYPSSPQQYSSFLKQNLGNCEYLIFTLKGEPVAVAVTDILNDGLAAVYTFFNCELSARSLGTLAILYQIQYCQRLNLSYLYLGYWVKECRKMTYKHAFQPLEYYVNDGWTKQLP